MRASMKIKLKRSNSGIPYKSNKKFQGLRENCHLKKYINVSTSLTLKIPVLDNINF